MKITRYFWLIFILVTLLCWIDYQYFTEGQAEHYSSLARQAGHIIILILIIPVGYLGWKNYPLQWFGKLWLYSYTSATLFIGLIGIIQMKLHSFGTEFLDNISSMRLFFTSPVPYFMLYVLHMVINRTGSDS